MPARTTRQASVSSPDDPCTGECRSLALHLGCACMCRGRRSGSRSSGRWSGCAASTPTAAPCCARSTSAPAWSSWTSCPPTRRPPTSTSAGAATPLTPACAVSSMSHQGHLISACHHASLIMLCKCASQVEDKVVLSILQLPEKCARKYCIEVCTSGYGRCPSWSVDTP